MSKKGKTLRAETRKLVFNLVQFAHREKELKKPVIELQKVTARVAAMTGFNKNTVVRIRKEAAVNNGVWVTPGTNQKRTKKIIPDSLRTLIKNRIEELYSQNQEPNLGKLFKIMKEEDSFGASYSTFLRTVKELGFKYITYGDSKKKVLIMCPDDDVKESLGEKETHNQEECPQKPIHKNESKESHENNAIPAETRKFVYSVIQFALREKELKSLVIDLQKVTERVVAMTGINKNTVVRIRKEGAVNKGAWVTPRASRPRTKKVEPTDSLRTIIKNRIEELYSQNKEPHLGRLFEVMKEKDDFPASRSTLLRTMRELGFKYITRGDSKVKILSPFVDNVVRESPSQEMSPQEPSHQEECKESHEKNTKSVPQNPHKEQAPCFSKLCEQYGHQAAYFDPFSGLWHCTPPVEGQLATQNDSIKNPLE